MVVFEVIDVELKGFLRDLGPFFPHFWTHFGPILDPFWTFGPILETFGPILAHVLDVP